MVNSFTGETVMRAWLRAEAKCECKRLAHEHSGRCNKALVWGNRGRDGWGAWETNNRDGHSDTTLSNCEILCWDCYLHKSGGIGTRSTSQTATSHRS
jgi:hypothetical protein